MTPWSVRPRAGWPKAAARAASASILHAPSRSEYSEWTCRWAQAGPLTALAMLGVPPDGWTRRSAEVAELGSVVFGDALQAVGPAQQLGEGVGVAGDRGAFAVRRGEAGQQRDERLLSDDDGGVGAGRGRRVVDDVDRRLVVDDDAVHVGGRRRLLDAAVDGE